MFRAIASDNFPPFGKFQLELPPVENKPKELGEVHLFTGVNGTGKTRILSVMAAMLGNPHPLVKRLKGSESSVTFFTSDKHPLPANRTQFSHSVADGNGHNWSHHGGSFHNTTMNIPAFAYSGMAYVADVQVAVMAQIKVPDRTVCLSFNRPEDTSKSLLQAITNLKLLAAMEVEDHAQSDTSGRSTQLVKALESTLTQITGVRFRFKVENYPNISLKVLWGDKKLSFDSLPDGLRSVIGWIVHALVIMDVWLQGKGHPSETEAIFLLDEIESHLHPAWQRRILPAFQRLFPKSQIFVATHSPFLIASLNHGWIHPLSMGSDGKVTVEKLIAASAGDSYVTVVEEIMGLKEWYDPETEQLLAEFRAARDAAYKGEETAQTKARQLAMQIGQRSTELDFMMGRELIQMDRQLAKNLGQ